MIETPLLEPHLAPLLSAPYPKFSAGELARRRRAVEAVMDANDVDHLLAYGIGTRGGAVGWLTQWVATNEAHLVFSRGAESELYVQYFNHVPLASNMARDCEVRWGGPSSIQSVVRSLERRGAAHGRVGVMGPLPFGATRVLEAAVGTVVDLNPAYGRLRLVKSEEELAWFRLGAHLGDLAIAALSNQAAVGMNERDLGALVEATWLPLGGVNALHYFAVNEMVNPTYCVPRQHPSTRQLAPGDIVTTEITANFFEYGGQILRSFTVDAEPTPLFADLHRVADMAFAAISNRLRPGVSAAELVAASAVIEENGFTTYDDLVHGYGGGYLAPVLGSSSRPNEPLPDFILEENMMLVVQPNVVTLDHRAGVQTGECLIVGRDGPIRLHHAPRGLLAIGR